MPIQNYPRFRRPDADVASGFQPAFYERRRGDVTSPPAPGTLMRTVSEPEPERTRMEPRGIEYFEDHADQLFRGPEPLSAEERERMHELSVREARLQPTERFVAGSPAPGAAGTFGIDTRQALTGLSDLILSIEDRRRDDELHGSPERRARQTDRAERLRGRAGEIEDEDMAGRLMRGAERAEGRAERWQGISPELEGLRARQVGVAETAERRSEFLGEQIREELDVDRELRVTRSEEEIKRETERDKQAAMTDRERELIDQRHDNRLELERAKAQLKADSDDPESVRAYVTAVKSYADAVHPLHEIHKTRLRDVKRSIDSLEKEYRLSPTQEESLERLRNEEISLQTTIESEAEEIARLWRSSEMIGRTDAGREEGEGPDAGRFFN